MDLKTQKQTKRIEIHQSPIYEMYIISVWNTNVSRKEYSLG